MKKVIYGVGVILLLTASQHAVSGGDLRAAVQNPISSLISVPFKFNFDKGADNGDAEILNIQPVIPVTIGNWNYVNRFIVPIIYAPGDVPGIPEIPSSETGEKVKGLGDINYSLYLSVTNI